ncbi:restriction endonuclease subunit S [Arenimonas sp. SCN 70-307]|uniref:restriction endonuclease subunit S n=1 Tax=Arenimonas sp. SCN 70-307 TaxID=1660089 RepID=UPI0025B91E3F|nr:restriction endonuclease subunit S [Arenimonas sp. SCN 70-307]
MKGYADYEECRLPWLGRYPRHWSLTKTKRVCSFTTGWTPPTGDSAAYEGDCPWANISDLGQRVILNTAKSISAKAAEDHGLELIPAGSLMFSFKLSVGQVAFAGKPMFSNEAIASFRESADLDLRFSYYAFPIFLVENAAENIYGAKLLNQFLIREAIFPLPPKPEQRLIADFLDREAAKIDALIDEQERLLALLAEKRQAVISHAVTKGLNPDAPMKDSGVAWMGQIPAHWRVAPLARVSRERCDGPFGSGIKSSHYTDQGALVVRLQNIRAGRFRMGEPVYLDQEYFESELKGHAVLNGDVLVAGLGDDNNLLGRACVAPANLGPALVKADCFRFRLLDDMCPEFIAHQLCAGAAFDAGQLATGTTRSRIPLSAMAGRMVAFPPMDEQKAIKVHIAGLLKKSDDLCCMAEAAIALLRERRAALIATTVTGQVDVRGV